MNDPTVADPNQSLRARIAKRLAGKFWPANQDQPVANSTASGTVDTVINRWASTFMMADSNRIPAYVDYEEMDDTVEEVATGLDILSREAVGAPEKTGALPFTIEYPEDKPSAQFKNIVEQTLDNIRLDHYLPDIVRNMLLYGDEFQQIVWGLQSLMPKRLMGMPPDSMYRNEDVTGALSGPNAYEQKSADGAAPIATFYPWQICHLRWRESNHRPYGQSLLYTARTSWKKMIAMEEAMVINWLTRAFARLLFLIDVTGKDPKEAAAAVANFKNQVATGITQADPQENVESHVMTAATDLYLGKEYLMDKDGKYIASNTDVSVLDTSNAAFQNLDPIQYYRSKLLMSLRVLPTFLFLNTDISARSIIVQQERQYARTINFIRQVASQIVMQPAYTALMLNGLNPLKYKFVLSWPSSSILDELDKSSTMFNYARAANMLWTMGVADPEYSAIDIVGMSPAQWRQVSSRIEKQLAALPPPTNDDNHNNPVGRPDAQNGEKSLGTDDSRKRE